MTSYSNHRSAASPVRSLFHYPETFHDIAPITIINGGDDYLHYRELKKITALYQSLMPDSEVIDLDAGATDPLTLNNALGASLFSPSSLVILRKLENASDALITALNRFLQSCKTETDPSETRLILSKSAGQKGQGIVNTLKKNGARVDTLKPLKSVSDKTSFVMTEIRDHHRSIDLAAARELVAAYGTDISGLIALCDQLCNDFDDDPLTMEIIQQYTATVPQTTGFQVADTALASQPVDAVMMLRRALESGVEPIGIIAAIASKLQSLALVAACDHGLIPNTDLPMAGWVMTKLRRQVKGFTSIGLARCFEALAHADEEAKTSSGDVSYALEQAVTLIATHGRDQ